MKTPAKILIVLVAATAAVAAVVLKQNKTTATTDSNVSAVAAASSQATPSPAVAEKLPRLVDLGADKCIPCKKMAQILKELKTDYAGQLDVEFLDVWKNPDAAKPYNILLIPTQIFYDPNGKEAFRHEGFYGKEDILAKWTELGVKLKSPK